MSGRAVVIFYELRAASGKQAVHFERLAGSETNATLQAELARQAVAYYRLAAKRAHELGVPVPKRAWSALDEYYLTNGLQVRTLAKIAEELGRNIEEVRARVIELNLELGPHNF